MIHGHVTADGVPLIELEFAGRVWPAIVDTGFNGDLELPAALRKEVNARFQGRSHALIAGGRIIVEDTFRVDFPFDGRTVIAEATFAATEEILVGTGLLQEDRLVMDFPAAYVHLQRSTTPRAAARGGRGLS